MGVGKHLHLKRANLSARLFTSIQVDLWPCPFYGVSNLIMAEISDSGPKNDFDEKRPYDVHRSSSDKSDGVGNEKSAVPVYTQDADTLEDTSPDSIREVFDVKAIDPVLSKKMALVNTAIDELGMTSFQWKLLFLNGFGYAVDSVC